MVGATLSIVGCSSGVQQGGVWNPAGVDEALTIAKANDLKWEIGILNDGNISATEYEEGYDRFMSCVKKLGYVFDKPKYLDPISGQMWR
jgi:hypothetical protein